MNPVVDILREAAIIIAVLVALGGGGYGILYLRRRMKGGIDDRLRLSEDPRIHRAKVWILAITAALWIGIFAVADREDRGRLTQAVKDFFGFVAEEVDEVRPKEPPAEPRPKDLPEIPSR